jgi:arginase
VRAPQLVERQRQRELVAESGLLTSLDVVEVNPVFDRQNETAQLAVELVASALGARIL